MKKIYIKIDGIHCNHCEYKIKNAFLQNKEIKDVEIENNIAYILYDNKLDHDEIIKTIIDLGYITKEEYISDDVRKLKNNITLKEFIIILVSIILIIISIRMIFGFNIFNVIPTIDSKITYSMLIITGLLTSIHCISMCGAINLMIAVNNENKNYKKTMFYNIGRIISYTTIGGIAGLIGSVLSISDTLIGICILLASLIMLGMSLNMLGIIKFKLPIKFKGKKRHTNSFIIGLLNGFMPCGPLQAMQIYALGTGNIFTGALSMLLFGIGTLPLMISIGIAVNFAKNKRKIIINKIASILILILSLVMLNRGLLSLNIDIMKIFNNYNNFKKATLKEDYQEIEFEITYDNYEDIIVQKGIPVKMIIHVDKNNITGCNNELEMKAFEITKELTVGDNIIEFTPEKTGTYTYTCWMNMIKNNIKVIDDENYFKEEESE